MTLVSAIRIFPKLNTLSLLAGILLASAAMAEQVMEPSTFLAGEQAPPAPTLLDEEQSFNWDKRVVSRGFGGRSVQTTAETPAIKQQYTQGQSAYFYQRYAQAQTLWQPLAEAGFADAQASLGWLYQAGLGVKQDVAKALHWYQLAAAQHHPVAENNLAVFYQNGQLVELDLQQARVLFERAAKQGYRFAQYNLAELLLQHWPQDKDARHWLQAAAAQNVAQAKQRLEELDPVVKVMK